MSVVNGNQLRQSQSHLKAGLQNELHRRDIRDFFEKYVRPKVSRAKDRVRKIKDIFPVFVRGRKFTRFVYEKV